MIRKLEELTFNHPNWLDIPAAVGVGLGIGNAILLLQYYFYYWS